MPYHIEILTINSDLEESAKAACESLNKVQSEFKFEIASKTNRQFIYKYKRDKYSSSEAFEWLDSYKATVKGNRPFIILIVDKFLSSDRWENIFGTTSKSKEFAIFTTHDFDQFLNDKIRYCRYYLVRYALSHLEPSLKSHNDVLNKNCIFHFKENKAELMISLDSGHICDNCRNKLQPNLTNDIDEAITKMLLVVTNQYPYSIIFKGGGVKGLAFAGALLELEKHFSFNAFAGTSAGAIAAILLGAGYKPQELLDELKKKDFNDFRDTGLIQGFFNLFAKGGFYPGEQIKVWIDECLKKKISKENDIKLEDLGTHTTVYASRIKDGTLKFDSKGDRKASHASFAARCSMSIPYYFTAPTEDGIKVYDGGLRNNFPVQRFINDNINNPVIGIYLKSSTKKNWFVINEILNMTVDGEEMDFVDRNTDKIVIIDTHPIKTTDFSLTSNKKEFLVLAGRIGALNFILKNYPDIVIEEGVIEKLEKKYVDLKYKI
jgi:predicted acylesterase/phospholipase RssA